mgnify:CR=1 FL=1
MFLGVAGPIAILYHCTYRMGATNSNVALWSMIIVSSSGLVGRYLYSRIHFGLYGSRANLDEIHFQASKIRLEGTGAGRLLPGFAERLDASEKSISFSLPLVPKSDAPEPRSKCAVNALQHDGGTQSTHGLHTAGTPPVHRQYTASAPSEARRLRLRCAKLSCDARCVAGGALPTLRCAMRPAEPLR